MRKFYGQHQILEEVGLIIEQIKKGGNYNILLSAPSGYGKSTLGIMVLKLLGWNDSEIVLPPFFNFNTKKRFHLLDEIQELENPEELYPLLDCGSFTTILCTNEMGSLKEPLVNRCIPLIFSPYSNAELLEMCKDRLVEFNLSEEKIQSIVNRCRGNPRVLNVLCRRLFYLLSYNLPKDVSALDNLIQEVLNLDTSGMSPMEYNYLEFLSNNGGRASLSLLVNGLHLSRDTILRDIEPQLIYNKLIRITSKGREINENNLELHGI